MCFIERYFKDCGQKDCLNNLLMERAHFVKLFNENNLKEYIPFVYKVFDKKIKEEAEEWLKGYLEEESLFKSAKDDVDNLACNLGHIAEKLQKHECVTREDWDNCFRLFDNSLGNGALSKVTKGEAE